MKSKPSATRRKPHHLRLPELEQCKSAVLNSLVSPESRRSYKHAIDEFIGWYCSEPRLAFNRVVVLRYRQHLEARALAPSTIATRVSHTLRAKRDSAIVALLLGCGLRRSELVALEFDHLQSREGHWVILDLVGKGRHIRTVPVPAWVKAAIDDWTTAASIASGHLFRPVRKNGVVMTSRLTQNVVWYVVKEAASRCGISALAPHDLRRTCARLCHAAGGELEQIQFLLGHASVQTTERYIGCKQRLAFAVNDRFQPCMAAP